MTNRLLIRTETQPGSPREQRAPRILVLGIIGLVGVVGLGLLAVPILVGTNAFFAASDGCSGQQTGTAGQPSGSAKAKSIPANYLLWYKKVGQQYGVPWTILAGIGTVESDNGQSTLPGVHSGQNGFGAAGPMQIGIGGASGNTWGGLPVHPASQVVSGVATDEDGGPNANVYNPADAIAGAAKYLTEAGVQTNPSAAIFAYNHLQSYVQSVLMYAGQYAGGNFSVASAVMPSGSSVAGCATTRGRSRRPGADPGRGDRHHVRRAAARQAVPVGRHRAGRLRLLRPGDDGLPDGRDQHRADLGGAVGDRAAGTRLPGTAGGPGVLRRLGRYHHVSGHVGLVIGNGKMIEAYATGFPIRVASYVGRGAIGFTEPWAGASSTTSSASTAPSVAGMPAPGMVVSPSSRASG